MRLSSLCLLLAARLASADGLTAEDVYQLDRAGVPPPLLVDLIRADGGEAIEARSILDMQELGTSAPVVAELMALDCARQDARPADRAILVVANRTGAPVGLRVVDRSVLVETTPTDRGVRLGDGEEARLAVDAARHEVRLDGWQTGLRVTPLSDDVRLELLPKLDGAHGPRARVTRGNAGLFEGPLLQPPPDPSEGPDDVAFRTWSCVLHAEVRRPRGGLCPTCSLPLVVVRDPSAPRDVDPRAWGGPRPRAFVCQTHPEFCASAPGKCPVCGAELQLLK